MDKSLKDLIGSVLIGLAGFGLLGFGLSYYNDIQDSRTTVENRQTILSERGDIVANLKKIKIQYEARAADIEAAASIIPASKGLPEIISSLNSLASHNGLILSGLSTSDNVNASTSNYNVVTVTIQLMGSYPGFDLFLTDIERNIRLMDIVSIDASNDNSGNSNALNFKLGANLYFLK